MRRALSALIPAALMLAGIALAAPAGAVEAGLPVRLVAPAAGTELVEGSRVSLEWETTGEGLGPEITEWEAFLSLNDGRTFPLRLTPHLGASIRRFTFRVPDFPTRQARLLLRFGDEREEVEVDVPGRFAIVRGPGWTPDLLPRKARLSRGEPARPGDGGVVVWTEGTRDGTDLREVAAVQEVVPGLRSVAPARSLLLPLLWPAQPRDDLPAPAVARLDLTAPLQERAPARTATPRAAAEIRRLIHRYNE